MSVFKTKALAVVAPILALTIGGLAGSLSAGTDMTISAGKLASNAKDYYGKTVTVKAEVEDVIDNRTFSLDEDALLAGADVLVIVPAGYAGTLAHDQVVTVTGKVRPFVTAELEKDYHWFKDGALVSRDSKYDFKTRPVLVATSVRTADGRDLLTGAAMPMTSDEHVQHAKMSGDKHGKMDHGMMMSAGKLAKDSKKYYGQNVTVRAEVEDVLDSHSFTLDEDSILAGPDVVVIVPAGFDVSRLAHDQVVTVSGKVRQYVTAELEKDYHWFKDGKIYTTSNTVDYKTRPVLIAETITTADGRTLVSQR
jgi:hypothetical protein